MAQTLNITLNSPMFGFLSRYASLRNDGTLGFKKALIVLWAVCLIYIMYLGLKPIAPDTGPYGDVMIHVISCTILMLLPTCTVHKIRYAVYAGILLAGMGVGLEIYQSYLPGRESSIKDEVSDIIGILLGLGIGTLLRKGYSAK
jgi:VanZ family protein